MAIAPTPGSAQGTTAPTARNFDCTATPHWPASTSHATIEYVATGLAVGQLRQVELEQIAPFGRDEDAGDLGLRERRLHSLGGLGPGDDRATALVGGVQLLVGRLVEPEDIVRQLQLALDRDLGDPDARLRPASAPSKLDRLAGLGSDDLDVRRKLLQLCRRPDQKRERPVVARHAPLAPSSSSATAASRGPIVKWSPIGSTTTSGS